MAGTRGAKPDPQSPVGAYGEELRRRREAAGYTQQALADEVVCSPSLIAHYEAGRRRPQREDARRLDRVLAADGFLPARCSLPDGPTGRRRILRSRLLVSLRQ